MIKNAKQHPKVFYGMHFYPGVAEYREAGKEPYRIFLNEDTLRSMDQSFTGKPVYVQHVEQVNLENIQNEADGFVVRSFYNKSDGKHWVEFLAVSDAAHQAIKNGWRLSNAYVPKEMRGGGVWNGVQYSKEVVRGEFEHLAIVPNPRYDESIILDADQFKTYNSQKEIELAKVANAKEKKSMFSFFKRSKVENGDDIAETVVMLPKTQKEITVGALINAYDSIQFDPMANMEHYCMVGEEKMTVNELVQKYQAMKSSAEAPKEEEKKEEEPKEEKKENSAEVTEPEPKKEEPTPAKAVEDQALKNAEELQNAELAALKNARTVETMSDQIARGKARYGSN